MNALGLNALASNHMFFRMHMAVLHLWLVLVCIWSYRLLQGLVDRYFGKDVLINHLFLTYADTFGS